MAGTYVAAWLTLEQAAELHVAGGEPAEELHLTLAYLGDLDPASTAIAEEVVQSWASRTPPVELRIDGVGRFPQDEGDCLWYSIDSPQLADARWNLAFALEQQGLEIDNTYDFQPHITFAYVGKGAESPIPLEQMRTLVLQSVALVTEEDTERNDIPLTRMAGDLDSGPRFADRVQVLVKDSPTPSGVHVDVPIRGSRKRRRRKRPAADVSVVKSDGMRQIIYGVVLEPHVEDTQGDWETPIEIEKAAHRYLSKAIRGRARVHTVQHRVRAFFPSGGGIVPVESFIAPCDFTYEGSTDVIRKGSWVLAAHVEDSKLWQDVVDGKFTGWSVGGSGRRVEVVGRTT